MITYNIISKTNNWSRRVKKNRLFDQKNSYL